MQCDRNQYNLVVRVCCEGISWGFMECEFWFYYLFLVSACMPCRKAVYLIPS